MTIQKITTASHSYEPALVVTIKTLIAICLNLCAPLTLGEFATLLASLLNQAISDFISRLRDQQSWRKGGGGGPTINSKNGFVMWVPTVSWTGSGRLGRLRGTWRLIVRRSSSNRKLQSQSPHPLPYSAHLYCYKTGFTNAAVCTHLAVVHRPSLRTRSSQPYVENACVPHAGECDTMQSIPSCRDRYPLLPTRGGLERFLGPPDVGLQMQLRRQSRMYLGRQDLELSKVRLGVVYRLETG